MIARRYPPIKWPDNARIALNMSVSFETWPDDVGWPHSMQREHRRKWPANAPFQRDLHACFDKQFGERTGIYRLMELFEREGVKSSFFCNGITVETFPDIAKELLRAGHELASETYIHDYSFLKTPEQDRADIHKCVAAFQKVLGQRPLGYLSPGHMPTDSTPGIVADEGYKYWVDPDHEELPYTLKVNGKDLVVMYYTLNVGDYSTFSTSDMTFREAMGMCKDAFDYLYEEGERYPSRLAITFHPYLIGRPYRMKVLEEFLHYVKGYPGVWFSRCIDVANWWLENYKDSHVEKWPNYWHSLSK